MVKVMAKVNNKLKVKVLGMVLGTQIKFHKNLMKTRHSGPSEKVILQEVNVKVKFNVKVKTKVNVKVKGMVIVYGTQIRSPENLVKIRQAGASEQLIFPRSRSW